MASIVLSNMSNIYPKVVGLTGGIGSGKSLAREMFQDLDVPCIDADVVARGIHQNATHPATQEIAKAFPNMIVEGGTLKRGSLQSFFANDQTANRRLKTILKPHVMATLEEWTAGQRTSYAIWESALILDEDIQVDRILTVDASEENRIARLSKRHPDWSERQIRNILAIQLPRKAYQELAQDVLCNDGSLEELRKQVEAKHRQYETKWGIR